jgi:hypothetical protein
MPSHLRVACVAYIVGLGTMAALMPFYETGVWRVVSPLLAVSFISIAVLFMLRRPSAWQHMGAVSAVGVVINAFFFPAAGYYGDYLAAAQVLAAIEIIASVVIFWSLHWHRPTRAWFERRDV